MTKMKAAINKGHYFILAAILMLGLLLRILGAGWGLPRTDMHPDEELIFRPAYDSVLNHTFEVRDYYRPNHVSIKLNTLLYFGIQNLYFSPKGLDDFAQNYDAHLSLFMKASRCLMALFGVGVVVLAYLIARDFGKNRALFTALLFAVFPSFIEHSHYLTPDIPLLFFLMGVLWAAFRYCKNPSTGWLFAMSFFTALATCEKYPGVYGCFIIATAVIATNLKKIPVIIKHGFLAILFLVLGIMAVSPVLVIDYKTVLEVMAGQNKQHHIGADGLNFPQTIFYYAKTTAVHMGLVLTIAALYGVFKYIRKDTKRTILLLVLFAYIIPISTLRIHWERYTLPLYAIGLFFGALGVAEAVKDIPALFPKKKELVSVLSMVILLGLPVLSLSFGAAAYTASFLAPDSRLYLMDEFAAMDVTTTNTVNDCNTPLDPGGFYGAFSDFEGGDPEKYKYGSHKLFVMTSSSQRDLYLKADEDVYGWIGDFYRKLDSDYPLVYSYTAARPDSYILEVSNIWHAADTLNKYLHGTASGYDIRLYQLKQ